MTDVIADEIATRSGASRYVVRQPESLRWHIPSKLFDPAGSPNGSGRSSTTSTSPSRSTGTGERAASAASCSAGATASSARSWPPVARPVARALRDRRRPRGDPRRAPRPAPRQPGEPGPPRRACRSSCRPRARGLGPFWADRTENGLTPHTEASSTRWPRWPGGGHRHRTAAPDGSVGGSEPGVRSSASTRSD